MPVTFGVSDLQFTLRSNTFFIFSHLSDNTHIFKENRISYTRTHSTYSYHISTQNFSRTDIFDHFKRPVYTFMNHKLKIFTETFTYLISFNNTFDGSITNFISFLNQIICSLGNYFVGDIEYMELFFDSFTSSNTPYYRDWETDRKSTRLNSSH